MIVAMVVAYLARESLLPLLGRALDVQSQVQTADVIIVLGGGSIDRDRYGSQLYQSGLAKHVIATGGPIGTESGMVGLVDGGVPRSAIVLANGTSNTHEDALLSRKIMESRGWQTALLVSDLYHMRRSTWTFQTAFASSSIRIWAAPVVGGSFNENLWWKDEDSFVNVTEEYLKLVYYIGRGYITPSTILGR